MMTLPAPWVTALALALGITAAMLPSVAFATPVPVSVDLEHAAGPGAQIRAVHGVSHGPKIGRTWRHMTPNYSPGLGNMDFVAGLNRTAVPAVSNLDQPSPPIICRTAPLKL